MADLSVTLGRLQLKNPVICGSSEFTMTEAGIRAALDAGAAAVVAKSVNESRAAARQLEIADYVLLRSDWSLGSWDSPTPEDSLFCRSGLAQTPLDDWAELLARADQYARGLDAYVIGSITVSEPGPAAAIAARLVQAVRCIELNVGAPHGREAAGGAVRQVTEAGLVYEYTAQVRQAVACPLIVKLPVQSSDIVGLAKAAIAGGADMVGMIGRFNGFMPDIETWEPVLGSWAAIGGHWALPVSLYWVSKCWRELPGTLIVGTNGARSGSDVVRFLLSGARAVEMASAVLTHGPGVLAATIKEIEAYAARKGLGRVSDLVGVAADRARAYAEIAPLTNVARPWERFGE
jgi:dihydroorotate dehydrogenase